MPVHADLKQNAASSCHTVTVKHSKKMLPLFQKPSFILLAREESVSPQIKVNVIANMAEIPPNACQCVHWGYKKT